MISWAFISEDSLVSALAVANSPAFLRSRLMKDPGVQYLSDAYSANEIRDALHVLVGSGVENLQEAARAYALATALFRKHAPLDVKYDDAMAKKLTWLKMMEADAAASPSTTTNSFAFAMPAQPQVASKRTSSSESLIVLPGRN